MAQQAITSTYGRDTVIFRCTGIGCTKAVSDGGDLPECTCGHDCEWRVYVDDNFRRNNVLPATVNIVGSSIFRTALSDLPEIGAVINFYAAGI